ncbi:MAG: hypothetical protein KF789_02470 [Bdellovibrionaceae bacterium]|nr:hypothetical protein [Pseudobdellovibrionaceae bacterium]
MRKRLCATFMAIGLLLPVPQVARADLFGADAAILAQILANALQQLAQLREILQSGNDTLGLLQDINRGINDSLRMAETLGLRVDPGLYRELREIDAAVNSIESLFGRAVDSRVATVQRNTDRTVAEAITFNNELNEYTQRLDRIGEEIKTYSHAVSPGGAAKLTAQSLGVMIHVMNQQIRATGQGLKLQAQTLALQNKQEKDRTEQYLKEGEKLKNKMQSLDAKFQAPRF